MTDFYKMSSMMKELFPSNPEQDKQALLQMANAPAQEVAPAKDYVTESVTVPQGSMPIGIDSVNDFAALAGIVTEGKQKTGSAGQAKGSDIMPKTSKPSKSGEQPHPLKDKLVGEDDLLGEPIMLKDPDRDPMAIAQRELRKGMELIAKGSAMIDRAQEQIKSITSGLKNVEPGDNDTGGDEPSDPASPMSGESIKQRLYKELAKYR
jgi:hypothetical protein